MKTGWLLMGVLAAGAGLLSKASAGPGDHFMLILSTILLVIGAPLIVYGLVGEDMARHR
ncbi:hypothetical protein [Thermoactinospora rubra]|uniref:hypothetical protein n=1 Tax=Thermoactinospora rubra TaxID=1088767 RepID=UPI001301BF6E|nr:hypothetical protein [Thermoactinospora rubra]